MPKRTNDSSVTQPRPKKRFVKATQAGEGTSQDERTAMEVPTSNKRKNDGSAPEVKRHCQRHSRSPGQGTSQQDQDDGSSRVSSITLP